MFISLPTRFLKVSVEATFKRSTSASKKPIIGRFARSSWPLRDMKLYYLCLSLNLKPTYQENPFQVLFLMRSSIKYSYFSFDLFHRLGVSCIDMQLNCSP